MGTQLKIFDDKKFASQFAAKTRALDSDVKWTVEKEFAKQAIAKSKDLQECIPQSVQDSILNVAMIGLSLNPQLGHAALVPRKTKSGAKVCTLQIMYKGLIHRVTSTGAMQWVQAKVVYENDGFELIEGTHPKLIHRPTMNTKKRGAVLGAYCIAKTAEGDLLTEWMPEEDILAVKAKSESAGSKYSPWVNFPDEMRKKSVVRRAWKYWPSTDSGVLAALQESMNKIEPSEFKEVEAEILLSDEQIDFFRTTATDAGLPVEKALSRLAKAHGYKEISDVPANRFDELNTFLSEHIGGGNG